MGSYEEREGGGVRGERGRGGWRGWWGEGREVEMGWDDCVAGEGGDGNKPRGMKLFGWKGYPTRRPEMVHSIFDILEKERKD